MSALARAGRPATALAAYAAARERLAEDLGVDPAEETTALHTALLRQPRRPRRQQLRSRLRTRRCPGVPARCERWTWPSMPRERVTVVSS
ncbi:MAG: BTAD domain-containing putative transcriptional regulator [Actinomycetota bacterium]